MGQKRTNINYISLKQILEYVFQTNVILVPMGYPEIVSFTKTVSYNKK